MTILVIKPGSRTSIQAGARYGQRHTGVATGGAADPLSLALANKLVGNRWDTPALEFTLLGPTLRFNQPCTFALAGANVPAQLNRYRLPTFSTQRATASDELVIGSTIDGARGYIAFAGGLEASRVLGSASTDLQAGFGGLDGRALKSGDVLHCPGKSDVALETPEQYRLQPTSSVVLRTCESAETDALSADSRHAFFENNWRVGQRADRMGAALVGNTLAVRSTGVMQSAPVFPGTVQCPESGVPYLLGVDAGTLGGYPRVAQVARLDRHRLGQLRPGDHLRFMQTSPEDAQLALQQKLDYWRPWLPEIEQILC